MGLIGLLFSAATVAEAKTDIHEMNDRWMQSPVDDGIPTTGGGMWQPNPNSDNPLSHELGGTLWEDAFLDVGY